MSLMLIKGAPGFKPQARHLHYYWNLIDVFTHLSFEFVIKFCK